MHRPICLSPRTHGATHKTKIVVIKQVAVGVIAIRIGHPVVVIGSINARRIITRIDI